MSVPERFTSVKGNNDLLQQVVDQLNKDVFGFLGEFKWTDAPNAYDKFVQDVEQGLSQLSRSKLMQVLYRVDISEHKMRGVWSMEEERRIPVTAQLILDRELQKVLTRIAYRDNN